MQKDDWLAGAKIIFPISISYIPLGLACGILLQQSGFHPFSVFMASLLIYGGASQFLIASMLLSGAAIIEIITMVFFINLRHLLMASTSAKRLKRQSTHFNLLFAQIITDESFAVNTMKFKVDKDWTPEKALAAGIIAHMTWVGSTFIGSLLGNTIALSTVVMNYVLTAMFIFLLVSQMDNQIVVWTGIFGMAVAILLKLILPSGIVILFASVLASLFGLSLELFKDWKGARLHES